MAELRSVKFDDMLNFHFLSRPSFSPDGSKIAYVDAQADLEKDGYNTNLWLYSFADDSDRQLTFSGEDKVYGWSRDGSALIFVSHRGGVDKKTSPVYRLKVDGGEAERLGTVDLQVSDLWELPDGQMLLKAIFVPEEPNPEKAQYRVYTQIPFWQNGNGFTGQRRAALALWTPDGELRRLTPETMNVENCVLSPDGKKALLTATDYKKVLPLANHVYELDLGTGALNCLSGGLEFSFKAAGWSGGRVIVIASGMKRRGMNENPTIYELKDGRMVCLAPDLDTSFHCSIGSDCRYGMTGQTGMAGEQGVTYLSTEGTVCNVRRNTLKGDDESLTPELLSADCFDVCGDRLAVIGFKGLNLQELYCVEGGTMRQLTRHNEKALKDLKLSEPVHFTVDNGEGLMLDSWYIKPVDFEEGKKYPTILDIHGGPKTAYGAVYFHEMQCWAAQGYAVIFTNPRGGDGRGSEFADIRGKYGTVDYRDITAMLDWAVKNLDFIDAERMGVTGGSYGGYMTNWMIAHTHRFKCAASQRCISNWISFDGVSDIGYTFGVDQQGDSGPLTDIAGAWNASPLKYVNEIQTPTLFIHSEEDYRCPSEQAFQIFTALQVRGIETRLCYFSGENHELSRSGKPRSRLARLREITQWMDRFLKK
ncbi:MAG: S9 family peptidase [Pyramidobacter sp.]|jgi:dipeptidyl aminopeptidase/acylaminoacyl peptidase